MTPPGKKLLVFSPLYPPSIGGLQNHAEQFNHEMVKAGHKILVFTPRLDAQTKASETVEDNLHILRFPASEIIPNYPIPHIWRPLFWCMWRKARGWDPEVVISRTRFFSTSLLAWLASYRWQTPWLHIEHGSDYPQFGRSLTGLMAHWYDITLGRAVLRRAGAVVANSQASADFVEQLTGRPATVIYRGIDAASITAAEPADLVGEHGIPVGAPVIVYAGRLIAGKGVSDLLTAFARLDDPSAHLLIIGDGPEAEQLKHQAGDNARIHFAGERDRPQVLGILKASNIFVNPSYTEGLPSAVIEAQLAGSYTIATDVGGTSEIQDVTLVPPRSIEALADAIGAGVKTSATPGRDSISKLEERFSWAAATKKYDALLLTVVKP
ncbi:hypothetical protein CL628_00650 [bacterium]|nr:hypothetical protein [bacterium]